MNHPNWKVHWFFRRIRGDTLKKNNWAPLAAEWDLRQIPASPGPVNSAEIFVHWKDGKNGDFMVIS
jgi:hypothetical protein